MGSPVPEPNPPARTADPACAAVPSVTVAICTRNRARFLEAAVASVLGQLTEDAELLIVDNASTDRTAAVGARLMWGRTGVTFCREPRVGLSVARNTALARARGEFVVFLDDDAVAEPGWLAAYRRFLSALPSTRIEVIGGSVVPEFEVAPPAWMSPESAALNLGATARRVSARGGPWGCNIAYRRAAALRVGGFDAGLGRKGSFLGLHEEGDLNQRLEAAGGEVWWCPQARIRHFVGAERLTLRWQLRNAFSGGRSTATMRWAAGRARRVPWGAARLVLAPVHAVFNLGLTLLLCCLGRSPVAVRKLTHAARSVGLGWQLLCTFVGTPSQKPDHGGPGRAVPGARSEGSRA